MSDKAKIRINLSAREIELEGTEAFIEKYSSIINNYLEIIKEPVYAGTNQNNSAVMPLSRDQIPFSYGSDTNSSDSIPDSFGEYYSRFPKSMKDVDKILVAGYYCQQKGGGAFSSSESSSLLIEQGVKLTNAAAFLKANLDSRKLFKHEGKYRISEAGIEYLKRLLQ
jgi:hypothetical protein